ncbi:MAG: hypothetical protein HQK51_05635 [Oligoflexia bacterium]|nr:hypothetical protein [Oligoflexia bacterium]
MDDNKPEKKKIYNNSNYNRSNNNWNRDRDNRDNRDRRPDNRDGQRRPHYAGKKYNDSNQIGVMSGMGGINSDNNPKHNQQNNSNLTGHIGAWAGNFVEVDKDIMERIRREAHNRYMEPSYLVNTILKEFFFNRKNINDKSRGDLKDFGPNKFSNCPNCGINFNDFKRDKNRKDATATGSTSAATKAKDQSTSTTTSVNKLKKSEQIIDLFKKYIKKIMPNKNSK